MKEGLHPAERWWSEHSRRAQLAGLWRAIRGPLIWTSLGLVIGALAVVFLVASSIDTVI